MVRKRKLYAQGLTDQVLINEAPPRKQGQHFVSTVEVGVEHRAW
ncbi:hypothetical protein ENSA7_14020 [Enhygromyxa salina]|uniref:Uncharacterized protein n=1 Tax=Enhygromyxa salina TaxID=215803 RepID=A0A2S9YUL3_9BACT|nr:hypothetical protein ENSA7_14020 [Enhygromyxa salina]